jgi:hypothetical protein
MHRNHAFPAQADELWNKLNEFEIDEAGSDGVFEARLMREQGWSSAFATRAVEEYKRFLFLAKRANHPVTPSKAVDEVWHLHMIFTRSYWERLCGRVLGRALHHEPAGGEDDAERFARQYEQTIESYRAWFGEPTEDVWPRRVEAQEVGELQAGSRPVSWGKHVMASVAVAVGVNVAASKNDWLERIVITMIVIVVVAGIYFGRSESSGGSGCGGCGSGCGGGCGGD